MKGRKGRRAKEWLEGKKRPISEMKPGQCSTADKEATKKEVNKQGARERRK